MSGKEYLRSRLVLPIILIPGALVSAAILSWIAYRFMFTLFQPYDDEGYLLISLAGYQEAPLYDDVYTQYGPFYYVLFGAVTGLFGLEATHDVGRLVTIVVWTTISIGIGATVWAMTRSLLSSLGGTILSFALMSTVANEPLHPGSFGMALLVAILLLGMLVDRQPRAGLFAVGALCGALAMVKVNIGAFAVAAVVATLLASAEVVSQAPLRRIAVLAPVAAAPLLLMAGDLDQPWVRTYAIVIILAIAGVVGASWRRPSSRPLGFAELAWYLAGLGTGVGISWLVPLLRGTSIAGVARGSLLAPLGQAEAFILPMEFPPWAVPLAVTGAIGGISISMLTRHTEPRRTSMVPLALLRLFAGLAIWIAIAGGFGIGSQYFIVGAALAWAAILPSSGQARFPFARQLLPLLALVEALHAYPVAGSQVSWSALLFVPLGGVCIGEASHVLAGAGRWSWMRKVIAAAPVAAFILWFATFNLAPQVRHRASLYERWPSLGLPGAGRVHLPGEQVALYRSVTSALRQRCSTFVSIPGMNSFHIFASLKPLTYLNATAWMQLFDDQTQRRVVSALRRARGACVLRNEGIIAFWNQARPMPRGPLTSYIRQTYRPAWELGGYEILTRRRP